MNWIRFLGQVWDREEEREKSYRSHRSSCNQIYVQLKLAKEEDQWNVNEISSDMLIDTGIKLQYSFWIQFSMFYV